jgi:hypothetical protein
VINKLLQALAVGVEVVDRPARHAGVDRRLGHRGRDLHDQARVERFGNQIFGTERELLYAISAGDDFAGFLAGESGDCVHSGDLHLACDRGRAGIECAAEHEGEAQNVVDLVWIVGAAGRDHCIVANGLGLFRKNLGRGIGERED